MILLHRGTLDKVINRPCETVYEAMGTGNRSPEVLNIGRVEKESGFVPKANFAYLIIVLWTATARVLSFTETQHLLILHCTLGWHPVQTPD
jgi:hypothetical protein